MRISTKLPYRLFPFLGKIFYTEALTITKNGRPPREVHRASALLGKLSDVTYRRLESRVKKQVLIGRLPQGDKDHMFLLVSKFVQFVDIKKCFPSLNINLFLKEYKNEIGFFERILITFVYNCPVRDKEKGLLYLANPFARPGLSLSLRILEIITSRLINKEKEFNVLVQTYVDDFAIYGDDPSRIKDFLMYAKEELNKVGLEFYGEDRPDKNSGIIDLSTDGKKGERLGLLFKKKDGIVFSRLRACTKKRYLSLLRRRLSIPNISDNLKAMIVKDFFWGRFGIYRTFPERLWNDKVDRKKFEIEAFKIAKANLPTFVLNGKELRNYIFYYAGFV